LIEFTLPSLGADMDEGTLLEWLVKPGEEVRRGQVVAVVDTAKAAIDVECWDEGTVDTLIAAPGAKIPVGTVLALLRAPGESIEQAEAWKSSRPAAGTPGAAQAARRPAAATPPAAPGPSVGAPPPGRRRISPVARRRAQELGVDIAALAGTGPDGAINIEDVERAAAGAQAAPTLPTRAELMRRTIAAAMTRAKREIPHYYLTQEILLERATLWLREQNAARPVTSRVLMAALFVSALAKTLGKFPEFNGFFRDGRYEPAKDVHVGLAVSLREGGLIAPALLNADAKSLEQVMRELTDLVRRARTYSLKSSELASATITLTNLGEGGVGCVLGVIYPPQVALVGFGAVAERAYAEQGRVRAAPAVSVSLAADHRVSDGHRGARFLAALGSMLQHPENL
jgi:pyruvate dehydrogenase E2 component (dihydrolipoamide acetyltransferase)